LQKTLLAVALTGLRRSRSGRSPTAASGRAYFKAIAGQKLDTDFFRAQGARRATRRDQAIIVRNAVFASKHSTRSIAGTIPSGVGKRRLRSFQHQIERDAEAAAKLSIAA
jgi:hypothetical protein